MSYSIFFRTLKYVIFRIWWKLAHGPNSIITAGVWLLLQSRVSFLGNEQNHRKLCCIIQYAVHYWYKVYSGGPINWAVPGILFSLSVTKCRTTVRLLLFLLICNRRQDAVCFSYLCGDSCCPLTRSFFSAEFVGVCLAWSIFKAKRNTHGFLEVYFALVLFSVRFVRWQLSLGSNCFSRRWYPFPPVIYRTIQRMPTIIRCRIFCLPGFYVKIQRLRYTEL